MSNMLPQHRYNSDLLINTADQEAARVQFQEIYHVLDHPELREKFRHYDQIANEAKFKVQLWGLISIFLATVALVSSALNQFLPHDLSDWKHNILLCVEACGIISVIIAAGGMFVSKHKKDWLEARLMSEILRQWYFDFLILKARDIEASCMSDTTKNQLRNDRSALFLGFTNELEGCLDSHLGKMIKNPETGYQYLHEPSAAEVSERVRDKIFSAYKQLRFNHQENYALYQLKDQTEKPFWNILSWPAKVLHQRLEKGASACLLFSITASAIILLNTVLGWGLDVGKFLSALIIILMIINVAIREVGVGLTAPESLERYNDYNEKIHYLRTAFENTSDWQKKFKLMAEMERAALEELKGFLRAHYNARFII